MKRTKLTLRRETVRRLTSVTLHRVVGGSGTETIEGPGDSAETCLGPLVGDPGRHDGASPRR